MRRGLVIKIIAREPVIKSLEERLKPINLAFLRPGARRRHDSRYGVCGESIRRGGVQAEPSASRRPQPNNFLRCPCRVERETPRRRGSRLCGAGYQWPACSALSSCCLCLSVLLVWVVFSGGMSFSNSMSAIFHCCVSQRWNSS